MHHRVATVWHADYYAAQGLEHTSSHRYGAVLYAAATVCTSVTIYRSRYSGDAAQLLDIERCARS
jgi:hypothetical protein